MNRDKAKRVKQQLIAAKEVAELVDEKLAKTKINTEAIREIIRKGADPAWSDIMTFKMCDLVDLFLADYKLISNILHNRCAKF